MNPLHIGGRTVAPGNPVYIVAEMSANHHREFEAAMKILVAAKEAGADAVKLQTYTPDTITIDSDGPLFQIKGGTIWDGRSLYELYTEAYTPWDWHPKLMAAAREMGLDLFSSPFDSTAVDFLETMDVPVYKVASLEVVDIPLIRKMAETEKPIIMSIGASTEEEISEAVAAMHEVGTDQIALLKCTSAYPAPTDEMNLRTIPHLSETFDVPVGLSDHTLSPEVPVTAVALGACIVEKHLTLSRDRDGIDTTFSLTPPEFRAMVDSIRMTEQALGTVRYGTTDREKAIHVYRRSLFAVADIAEGETLTEQNVRSIRPGHGLPPKVLDQVLGRQASRTIARGTPLSWDLLAD